MWLVVSMVDLSRSCKKEQLLESRNKHVHTCIYQPTLMEIGVVMQCIANLFVKQNKKKKKLISNGISNDFIELFLFDSLINRWSFILISALIAFKGIQYFNFNFIRPFSAQIGVLPTIMIRLSIIKADFRPSFSPDIPPAKAPVIEPITKILAEKKSHYW